MFDLRFFLVQASVIAVIGILICFFLNRFRIETGISKKAKAMPFGDIVLLTIIAIELLLLLFLNIADVADLAGAGQMGDLFGGFMNPIVGIASAILVWLTLRAQITANRVQVVSLKAEIQRAKKESTERNDFELMRFAIDSTTELKNLILGNKISKTSQNNKEMIYGAEAFIAINKHFKRKDNSENPQYPEIVVAEFNQNLLMAMAKCALILKTIAMIQSRDTKTYSFQFFSTVWISIGEPIIIIGKPSHDTNQFDVFFTGALKLAKGVKHQYDLMADDLLTP